MSLGGGDFEKGKRGPDEPKATLFTIDTEFLASRLNVTINERNLTSEKENELGGPFKGSKRVIMGQKSYFRS